MLAEDLCFQECTIDNVLPIFNFLVRQYGLSDTIITLNDESEILVKKYNIIGYTVDNDYINVYESNGELRKILYTIKIEKIKSLRAL